MAIKVPVDIKPLSCSNPLNVKAAGILPAAVLGTASIDVTRVDPATVKLEGVAPLRWSLSKSRRPHEPYVGKQNHTDCVMTGPDRFLDLMLMFDKRKIEAALDASFPPPG